MCALIVDKAIPGLTAFVSHTLDCKCGSSGTGSDEHQRRGKSVGCLLKRAQLVRLLVSDPILECAETRLTHGHLGFLGS